MEITLKQATGMQTFIVFWFGQVISVLGTGMTSFALAYWAWQTTGSATALSLLLFFAIGPAILFGPIAGAIVDRNNRKFVIMLADTGAGLSTAALLFLYTTGTLQIWHVYAAGIIAGLAQAFHMPATWASITLIVTKKQYGRANGMMSLVSSISEIAAPLAAGMLLTRIGIGGIMIIDLLTFAFAIVMTAVISIPQPVATPETKAERPSFWNEATFGFHYIIQRPSLLGLQLVFLLFNFASVFQWALQSPMILARTGQDAQALSLILATAGIGGVLGGLVMSSWGGPKRKVHGVLGGMTLTSLFGIFLMGLGRTVSVWMMAAFFSMFFVPIINGSNQAIWQAKVAPELQGRVFAVRRMIAQSSYLIGFLAAGPLADRFFEPVMQPGSALAEILGGWFGAGPGVGMALLMALWGLIGASLSLGGYLFPVIRNVETLVADHDLVSNSKKVEPSF